MVLALIAVMTGIAATLLTGNNLLSFGSRNNGAATGGSVSPATPSAPSATTPAPETTADTAGTSPPTVIIGNADSEAGSAAGVVIPVLPPLSTDAPGSSPGDSVVGAGSETTGSEALAEVAPAASASPPASTAATQVPASTETTTTAPATTATTIAPSSNAPFRISVGAYGSGENAQRRADTFSAAGFPVFTAVQNDLTLVLVGPFDSQAEADQIAARIRSQGLEPNPVIYEFRPEGSTTPAASPAQTTTPSATTPAITTPAATTPAVTTPATPSASNVPAPASSGRYLQVGAYGSMNSATPQRTTLESIGFEVRHVEEGGLVKLLVGPYDDAALSQAQGILRAQGIDSFVR